MKIVNGTSHEINIYDVEDCIPVQNGRKLVRKQGAVPKSVIAPGTDLNARKGNKPAPSGDFGFPVKGAVIFTDADPLPDGDLVIVSNIFRSAYVDLGRDTSRLGTVDGTVYIDEQCTRPCGCTAIAIG